jgi:hypothetical protein
LRTVCCSRSSRPTNLVRRWRRCAGSWSWPRRPVVPS